MGREVGMRRLDKQCVGERVWGCIFDLLGCKGPSYHVSLGGFDLSGFNGPCQQGTVS